MLEISSKCPSDTKRIGRGIAKALHKGSVVLLEGRPGAGKTALAQGIAAGLGVKGVVGSPTFAIVNEHEGEDFPVYHIDLYRLEGAYARDIGLEEYLEGEGVCIIEWPRNLPFDMPGALNIEMEYVSEDERRLRINAPEDVLERIRGLIL